MSGLTTWSALIKTLMKQKYLYAFLLLTSMLFLDSCAVIGGIFKAGAVVGVIAVIIVIALIVWIISLFRSKNP